MTNEEIRRYFEEEAEDGFRKFTSGLILGSDLILGVRVPKIRALAKRIAKEDWRAYLAGARDDSYEEIMLQGLVIGYAKGEINEMLSWARGFLPKIHDWSVNDAFCSTFKTAQKHRPQVWDFLMEYKDSPREFEQRVVAVMLMNHFLTEEYLDRVFGVWNELKNPGYYRKMGVAWGIATAYAKFPEKTHEFLLENDLDDETYHMAIRKLLESFRISGEQKEILRNMKRT